MNLEGGFTSDTGASQQGGRLFGRVATVGLQGSAGTLTLGRQAIVLNDIMYAYDPMYYALYSVATLDGKFFGRTDNSIKYVSPTVGGLSASGYYSFGLDTAFTPNQGEVAGNAAVGRAYGLGLRYAADQVDIGLVYDRANSGVIQKANNGDNDQRLAIAGNYQFSDVKLFAGYEALKSQITGTGELRSYLYWTGVTVQQSAALKLTGAFYHNEIKQKVAGTSLFVLNADYALSKRTDIYTSLAYTKNSTDGITGSSVGVTAGGQAISSGAPGVNQAGLVFGVRHKF